MPARKKSRRGYNLRKDYIPENPASSLLNDSGISADSNHQDNLGEAPPKMENTAFRNNENLNVDIDKFPTVCRFCLSTGNVKSIFKLKYNDLSFHRIIESCISVQVTEGDNLPQNVCFLCVNEVIRFHKFIVKTQECDALLKDVLSTYMSEKFQSPTSASPENPPAPDVLESDFISIIKFEYDDSILNEATETKHATVLNDKEPLVKSEPSLATIASSENAPVAKVCESDSIIITNCYRDDGISNQATENVEPTTVNSKEPSVQTETSISRKQIANNATIVGPQRKKNKNHKKTIPNTVTCSTCSESFQSLKSTLEHCRKTGHQKPRLHKCLTCDKGFVRRHQMLEHIRAHTKEKPFMCYICGVRFSLSCSLWRHSKTHTGEKPHVCEVCGTGFIQAASLVAHRETHPNKISFTCAHCNKCFSQVLSYKQHLRLQHPKTPEMLKKNPNLLQHKCNTCGKLLSSKSSLRTHMLSHGEKSYLCNNCGKSFATKVALQLHMRVHTGVRPYTCKFCNKSFSQPGTLQSHFLIHTGEKPFVCKVCSKAFNHRNALKFHMKTHSGEKPYSCSFCGKSFARKGNLTVHVRTHTGETPYICDICGKGFCDSSSMKKHRRVHAKSDMFTEPGS